MRRLAHLPPSDLRRKFAAYMARRGFSYAVIGPLVEEEMARSEDLSDIESEENDNA